MMNNLFTLQKYNRIYLRFLGCLVPIIALLLWRHWAILDRFTITTFTLFVLPYVTYLLVWFFILRFVIAYPNWWPLAVFAVAVILYISYWAVKEYFYNLLPRFDILFVDPERWTPARQAIMDHHVTTGHLILWLIILVDLLFWDKLLAAQQTRLLRKKIDTIGDSALLSAHFLRALVAIQKNNRIPYSTETSAFYSYVIDKNEHKRVLVSLEEEWDNVLRLVAICTHRRILIKGEVPTDPTFLNRSIPALSILTWMENAIKYSYPEFDHEFPITLEWIWVAKTTIYELRIRNRIMTGTHDDSTKQGLTLLTRITENLPQKPFEVTYHTDDTYFEVRIQFIN